VEEKEMRVDVMVDIETLGTKSDSTIFQISAMVFDITTGAILDKFNRIADITKNEDYEMSVTGSTLVWWLNTNPELLADLLNKGKGSSKRLLEDFHRWLDDWSSADIHLWGNGILFDNKMIQHQFENIGLEYPVKYTNDRDVRTIVDLTCAKLGVDRKELRNKYYDPGLEPHDAFNDVFNQINIVVNCLKN
jgi:hypothetical protein